MPDRGTFETIIGEIANALKPLYDAQQGGAQAIRALFREAGVDPDLLLKGASVQDLISAVNTFATLYGSLRDVVDNGTIDLSKLASLISLTRRTVDSFSAMDGLQLNDGLPAICQKIGEKILNYLVLRYLHDYHPKLYFSLLLGGIADDGQESGSPFLELHLDRIPKLLSDPGAIATDVYKWGTNEFRSSMLLVRLNPTLAFLGIPSRMEPVDAETNVTGLDSANAVGDQQLRAPLYEEEREGAVIELGLAAVPLDADGLNPKGIGIVPFGTGEYNGNIPLDDDWTLNVKASSEAMLPWGVGIRPNKVGLLAPSGSSAPAKAKLHITIERNFAAHEKNILFGEAGGSRVELGTVGLTVGLEYEGKLDFFVELPVRELRAVISAAKGDGFLRKIIPENGIEANFDLALGVSSVNGVYFRGCAGLEISLPTHISLGPLEFQALTIALKISDSGIPIVVGATVKADLGPVKATIENMGIRATFSLPNNNQGNLGPVDLALAFEPPKGVGLSLDVGIVKGGGYLYFDFDKEEYAGVLELTIAEMVSVKAIGLITTRMPDNSKGFSLLLIITAEFGTGVQLGFGFTLMGVGGLAGLNRAMLPEPIAAGIKSGGINSIMFPPNPVENAPKIISDLRTYFPPAVGIFLIGPMAKIGWGTPTLISLAMGVIIEIPGNIAIIGVLRVNLPTEEAAIVSINVGFIGALEFDKQRLWFYASLFDSHILFLTLEGDMGLLMDYSENSNFVLSVGGFHPMFSPPPLPFPNPRRLRIDILNTSVSRISVEAYFAVTSNTVQFGASAELYYGLAVVGISGHFAFDALFQFSPFKFIIQLSFSVSLKVFGIGLFSIHLQLMLEGPTPWHAKGTGKLTIDLWLFEISISASFDTTWGDAQNTTLPSIEVVPLLKQEFEKDDNWRASLPAGSHLLVSLRQLDEQSECLVLHPVGTLQIAQRAVPLNLKIDKVGNRAASDGNNFSVAVSSAGLGASGDVPQEMFAIAQYQELSNDEKLTRPSFQKFDAGLELSVAGRQLGSPKAVRRVVRYETIIIDSNFKRFVMRFFAFVGTLFGHFLAGAAVKKSKLSKAYKKSLVPYDEEERIQVDEPRYVVAAVANNKPITQGAIFHSEAMAHDYMTVHLADNPNDAGEVHVIPAFEAA